MKLAEHYQRYIAEVNAKAGDAVIFTEALTHGTVLWKGKHQHRALLYKFSPGFHAFGGSSHRSSFPNYI